MKILKKTSILTKFFIYLFFLFFVKFTDLEVLSKNIRVIDGDTIYFNKIKYRLYGIDAPEIKQTCKKNKKSYECGKMSKRFLESQIIGESFFCEAKDKDRYKRIVAICYINNLDLNKIMVKNGWAVAYRKFSNKYISEEIFAKQNKLGIWEGTFMEPSLWRRFH